MTVSLTLPSDGETIDAADVNQPFNTLANAINGNLDSTNISSLNGTKLNAGTLPGTALDTTLAGGWLATGETWSVATGYNKGNKEFDITVSGDKTTKYSPGMRVKFGRGTTPPTQCTDLESSSSQYWSKTSPTGISFTDDFTCEAWIKLESYTGVDQVIISRYNGTSGWRFVVDSAGKLQLQGYNGGSGNYSATVTDQGIPLNTWVHVAAVLDMSTFTSAGSPIYMDGISVPVTVGRGGTNPTALVQAGNLQVGASNGATGPFDGEIADARVWSAARTQTQIRDNMYQQLVGNESNLVVYFKFNGDANDSTANANNLSAVNSATATTVDNPMKSTEYGVITKVSYSNPNTTITVFTGTDYSVPNMTLTSPSYSTQTAPYGFPIGRNKWRVFILCCTDRSTTSTSLTSLTDRITVPTGAWKLSYKAFMTITAATTNSRNGRITLSSNASTETNFDLTTWLGTQTVAISVRSGQYRETFVEVASATSFTVIGAVSGSAATLAVENATTPATIEAECAYL